MKKRVIGFLLVVVLTMTAATPLFADDRNGVHFHGYGYSDGLYNTYHSISNIRVGPTKYGANYMVKGFEVSLVQDLLWSFYRNGIISQHGGSYDGIYGAQTIAGITAFQKKYGLYPDGIVGPDTWAKMEQVYKKELGSMTLWFYDYGLPGTTNQYRNFWKR